MALDLVCAGSIDVSMTSIIAVWIARFMLIPFDSVHRIAKCLCTRPWSVVSFHLELLDFGESVLRDVVRDLDRDLVRAGFDIRQWQTSFQRYLIAIG